MATEALQAARRGLPNARWRGVTGSDAPSVPEVPDSALGFAEQRDQLPTADVSIAPFVAIETAAAADAAIAGFGFGAFDLIVSSWTWFHLGDPLATLELWANHLAVGGSMFVNKFRVAFDGAFDVADEDAEARWARIIAMRDGLERIDRAQGNERTFELRFWAAMEGSGRVASALHLRRLGPAPIRFAGVEYTGDAPPMNDGLSPPGDSARIACTTYRAKEVARDQMRV